MAKRGFEPKGFDAVFAGDVPLGAGMSSSAALESTFAFALSDLLGYNIERFELALIGQATEHNYCGVMCGIMDQFASLHGKEGYLVRLDCRSLEYAYFPFDAAKFGYRLVLINSRVKHELVGSPYNERRASCERVAAKLGREFLRGVTQEELDGLRGEISAEDYQRACYVVGEEQRVMEVCRALEAGDLERVGEMMYATHHGLSAEYEVSCEELDMLVDVAKELERVEKELEKARKNLAGIEGKLSNEKFTARAPEAVVAAEREKAAKARDLIEQLEESANALKKL
jgi:galactokinase